MKPLLLPVFGNMPGLANMSLFLKLVNYLSALFASQLLHSNLSEQPTHELWTDLHFISGHLPDLLL